MSGSQVYQDLSIISDELGEAIQPFIEKANSRGVNYLCIAKLMGDKDTAGYTIRSNITSPDMVLSVANALVDEESAQAMKIKAIVIETTDGRVIPVIGKHTLMINPEAGVEIDSPASAGKGGH